MSEIEKMLVLSTAQTAKVSTESVHIRLILD